MEYVARRLAWGPGTRSKDDLRQDRWAHGVSRTTVSVQWLPSAKRKANTNLNQRVLVYFSSCGSNWDVSLVCSHTPG